VDYYAHTPNGQGAWHGLVEHLGGVASRAKAFGQPFGAAEFCEKLGWLHDAGKFNPEFQRYLRDCARGMAAPRRVTHSSVGGWMARSCSPAVFPILGHHGGMPDLADAWERLQEDWQEVGDAARQALEGHGADLEFPEDLFAHGTRLDVEFLIRAAFSALVDADFLDTETHFQPEAGRLRGTSRTIGWYKARLDEHLALLQKDAPRTAVNAIRDAVLEDCRRAATGPPGFYRLTVPTGGGKTLSSLAFALDHAATYGMERVIYAIPYTSIIDQTADVYSGIFGSKQVLEHHSAVADEDGEAEDQDGSALRRRLAAENWDARLVVTTNVQLFDSLFSNRPSRARKVHNVARSVIVLDEVQTLPATLVGPAVAMLEQVASRMGSTVVLCTATQPAFEAVSLSGLDGATEIVPDPGRHFAALQRTRFESRQGPANPQDLAAELERESQVLCILNGRRDAAALLRLLEDQENAFHLSALMCPAHRRKVLADIRQRLRDGLPCRVVSTQVVEAGVDLDFPAVYRATAPLDRIIQAAGRCNREGRMGRPGSCVVFALKGGANLRGEYGTGTGLARTLARERVGSLTHPDTLREYFRDLYANVNTDAKGILALQREFCFREVAARFRLIEDATTPVIVPYIPKQVSTLVREAKGIGVLTRSLAQRLSQFAVSLYDRDVDRHLRQGAIEEVVPGFLLWHGPYDEKIGIGDAALPDPADLVV
jgi:CRISPR-associated endonuclease/helicase Cas3